MNKKMVVLGTTLLGLCSCSTYQGISVNKAIEILESVQKYSEYDIPTLIEISSSLKVYGDSEENDLIKSQDTIYEMSYNKKTMHIKNYENDLLSYESYGGTIGDNYYIFIENQEDGKRYWEVDLRLYNTILLNFMGLTQAMFSDESNFEENLSFLDAVMEDKNYYKNQYQLSSNGKGNLRLVRLKNNDSELYLYDNYRLAQKDILNYANNHTDESSYTLEEGEHHRVKTIGLIYKDIKIVLPDVDDYILVSGNPPEIEVDDSI